MINEWKSRQRINYKEQQYTFKGGQRHTLQIDYVQERDMAVIQFDIISKGTPTTEQLFGEIGQADTVIFVGGISPRLKGEEMKVSEPGFRGGDRTDIELPQVQRNLLKALHDAGKTVVLVNCSGGAVGLVPESKNCNAIIQAWYGGEQGGQAVADIIFGDYNPSGKLPITFYRDTTQLPDFEDYSMANRTYRYFRGEPLFPFGYGLSYTTFAIGKPKYDAKRGKLLVSVTNTGKRQGTETLQAYVRNTTDSEGPLKTLRGYRQVTLTPGERQTVEIDLPKSAFEWWDKATNTMRILPGTYEIGVGTSSRDIDLNKTAIKIN